MRDLKFALIGAGFMGKAHSLALAAYPIYIWPSEYVPRRDLVVEATEDLATSAAQRFGFARSGTDWRAAVEDPDIDVVDILLPNGLHREVAEAALAAGKHVICEKPLAATVEDARAMAEAAKRSGLVHQVGFNWRLAPAVQHASSLIAEGAVGEIRSIRAFWKGEFFNSPEVPMVWRFDRSQAGSGALGDVGSHAIDFARFLVGEISRVSAVERTYVTERDRLDGAGKERVDVDDATAFLAEFSSGAYGYIEGTWSAPGRKSHAGFEITGSIGSITFDWERMNELRFYSGLDSPDRQGFRTILIGPEHPNGEYFWPVPGYQIGFGETKVLQIHDFIKTIAGEQDRPQTTFEDGLKCVLIDSAVHQSAVSGDWTDVEVID